MSKVNVFTAAAPMVSGAPLHPAWTLNRWKLRTLYYHRFIWRIHMFFKLHSGVIPRFTLKSTNIILPSIHVKNTYVFQIKFGTPTEFYAENGKPYCHGFTLSIQAYFKLNPGLLLSFMVKTANVILPSIRIKNTYVSQITFGTPTDFHAENRKSFITTDSY